MAKSSGTFAKKDREKRKQKERQEKLEKKAEQKSAKAKSFDEMIAYVDEFGRFSSTPPQQRKPIDLEEIQISISKRDETEDSNIRTGVVASFDESKGYGFVKDSSSQESIFVHASALTEPIKQGDRVTFEANQGERGLFAVNVKHAV
jgi:cold shock CspA family protein